MHSLRYFIVTISTSFINDALFDRRATQFQETLRNI